MSHKKIPKLMCEPGGQTYSYGHVHVYVYLCLLVERYTCTICIVFLLVLEAWLERRGCQSHCYSFFIFPPSCMKCW